MCKKISCLAVFILLISSLIGGCSQVAATPNKEVIVFAASSLTEAMTEVKSIYEEIYPDRKMTINFAGSKTLRTQLENGAKADIFISANIKHYLALQEQGFISKGHELLKNKMVLVLSKDNIYEISSMEDLLKPHDLILAEENVPAGDYARTILENCNAIYGENYYDGVLSNLVSSESNVRQVLTKVVLGEADAAIVYATDITESVADKLQVIEIPDHVNVVGTYCIGCINDDTSNPSKIARDCYEDISSIYMEVFEKYGFELCLTDEEVRTCLQ